ncbi:MAG: tyrosine-type recombinase/integrase [Acidobacteriaceae bacterium]
MRHLLTVEEFGHWLQRWRVPLHDVTFAHARKYVRLRGRRKGFGALLALKRLLEMLAQEGRISPMDTPRSQVELVAHNFGDYLREERALARRTINNRKTIVIAFLAQRFGKRPFKFSNIKAEDLIAFVQMEAVRRRKSIKSVETALRSFMRYLLFTSLVSQDLSIAIPSALNRRFTSIPRYLTADQVSRVLASCNRQTRTGRRDYAILLLLARLGLRSGEVEALTLDDIDWTTGTLTVHGKGGKVRQMPLLHDVGKAISVYLRKDRLSSLDRRLFQRIGAPHHGLGRTVVGSVVRFALERSGVQSTSRGSHQFRHTIGSQMLAKGASLAEIGEVLRHESPDTTFIYTKVDLGALHPLALHWPGGAR